MSRTHKVQKAHEAYANSPYPFNGLGVCQTSPRAKAIQAIQKVAPRYGNQRKMRALLKVKARKSRRMKEKKELSHG